MNKRNIFIPILLLLLASGGYSSAQDKVHFTNIHEQISINEDGSGFRSNFLYKGFTESELSSFRVTYGELESIGKITARYKNAKGKLVRLSQNLISNNALISNSFYTGEKQYDFQLPKTQYFEYSYEDISNELMLFSNLSFRTEGKIDTVSYEVNVPLDYTLIYKPFEIDSTINFTVDSLVEQGKIKYHFTAINHIKFQNSFMETFFLKNEVLMPSLKLIVVPAKYKMQPDILLNQWYSHLINTLPPLDSSTASEVKNYMGSCTISDSVIKKIFHFVQSKIKYIDVENGIQAYRPHDANTTCLNKEGDCKDMAFLLYNILKYYGLNGHLALSATLNHYCDMDFSTPSCANHVICVLKRENKWIYLDATEKECEYGLPSAQIQGRHIFIVGDSAGEFVYVPAVPASINKSFFTMKLNVKDKKINGNFNYDFRHKSGVLYKIFSSQLKKSDFEVRLSGILANLTPSVTYTSMNTSSSDSSFVINGNISLKDGSIIDYSNKKYLSLNFIPYLDLLPKAMNHKEKMITYSTLNKITDVNISFQDTINLANPREEEYSEGDFKFKFIVKKVGLKEINISSSVVYDDVEIKNADVDHYNKLIGDINNQLNKGIIYE